MSTEKFTQTGTKDGHTLLKCNGCGSPHRSPPDKVATLRCYKCEPLTLKERGL